MTLATKNYSIQALRAIAAMLVVIDHAITQFNLYNDNVLFNSSILKNIESLGIAGVYVFFIISGYIMTMTTTNYKGGISDASTFMKKRILRILPTYWVWLTILVLMWCAGLALRSHDYSTLKIVSSYLLLPYSDGANSSINPMLSQGWTLIYEMFYYYLFAAFILLKIKSKQMILWISLSFMLLCSLAKFSLLPLDGFNTLFSSAVVFFFPLEMLIFHIQKPIARLFSSLKTRIILTLFMLVSVACVLLRNGNELIGELNSLCAILIFFVFYVFNVKTRSLSIIGDASYSIYLSHTFIVMAYGILCKSSIASSEFLIAMVIPVIVISIAFGIVSYYLIEKKLTNLTKLMTRKVVPLGIPHG